MGMIANNEYNRLRVAYLWVVRRDGNGNGYESISSSSHNVVWTRDLMVVLTCWEVGQGQRNKEAHVVFGRRMATKQGHNAATARQELLRLCRTLQNFELRYKEWGRGRRWYR